MGIGERAAENKSSTCSYYPMAASDERRKVVVMSSILSGTRQRCMREAIVHAANEVQEC